MKKELRHIKKIDKNFITLSLIVWFIHVIPFWSQSENLGLLGTLACQLAFWHVSMPRQWNSLSFYLELTCCFEISKHIWLKWAGQVMNYLQKWLMEEVCFCSILHDFSKQQNIFDLKTFWGLRRRKCGKHLLKNGRDSLWIVTDDVSLSYMVLVTRLFVSVYSKHSLFVCNRFFQ
jgi:hypothetical protein